MKKTTVLIMAVVFGLCVYSCCHAQEVSDEVAGQEAVQAEPVTGKFYICEKDVVTMDMPGKCPVCGNDLVEQTAAPAIKEEPEVVEEAPAPAPAE